MHDEIAKALEVAERELASKKTDFFRLRAEVVKWERTVYALKALVDQPQIDINRGLTECVKTAVKMVFPAGQYATTVRLKLEEAGFALEGNNPMASIHSILKRLVDQGYVKPSKIDGKTAYFWQSDTPMPKERKRRGRGKESGAVESVVPGSDREDFFGGEDE